MKLSPDSIPAALKASRQWSMWKKEARDGKSAKVPYQPDGKRAKSNDSSTWHKFDTALTTFQDVGGFDGICWMMPVKPAGLIFIDIDHCIKDGIIEPRALEIIKQFDSYTERSQSGNGLHIMIKGKKPIPRCRKAGSPFEIYDCLRPCYLTGDVVEGYNTIEERQDRLNLLYEEIFSKKELEQGHQDAKQKPSHSRSHLSDKALILKATLSKGGDEFKALFDGFTLAYNGDDSAADMALMNKLAFWTGGDALQMERIFSDSGLGRREKWRSRSDYRERTIQKALADAREFYEPPNEAKPKADPTLRAVSLDDPKGWIGVDSDGCIKSVECDKDGQKVLKWLSDCALCIHTETTASDTTEFTFKGTGAKDKRQVSFTLPASALADPRKFKAALINAFGAKNRVGRLDFEAVQRLTRNTRLMKRVEIPAWDGNMPLLPGVNLAGNVEYRLSSKIPAGVCDGDLQAAKNCLRKLLNVHKYAPVLVAVILGSPAIARWHKNDRFGLGLWGGTGTLKTSTTLAAMGIYGTGYLDGPKLKAGKGGSTIVGAMEVFAASGFLPQIYDDVKTVDQKDAQNYVATMHAVLEGEEKARGKKDGGLRESREFACIPIVTGEVRPQEASTSARVFNLNWTHADGKLLSEVQQSVALLPVIGYHWLRFLAETDFVLGKDFEAFRSNKMQYFLGLQYTNPGRLATIYALLLSIWELLEASPVGDVFSEAREGFMAALQMATEAQGQAVSEETEISRFLNGLEELIASNPGLIVSEDGRKTIAGAVIGKWTNEGLFLLPTETLNELNKIKAFNQLPTIDSITQALNVKGLLIVGEDKHLKTHLRFNGRRPRGWHIKAEAVPVVSKLVPPDGTGKNNNSGANGPTGPAVPPKKKENVFEKNTQNLEDPSKHFLKNTGTSGTSGTSSIVNRLVDSDFDSKVSGPTSGPTDKNTGTICGVGPHPRKEESPSSVDPTEKIRVAAYMEFGINGEVDPAKVAAGLRIPLNSVATWLDANYTRLERPCGVVRYIQRGSSEATT